MPAPATRVLFLGLDGGTMRVLAPAFARGWMPHLAALWRRAAFGTLRSTTPMVTPVACSTAPGSAPSGTYRPRITPTASSPSMRPTTDPDEVAAAPVAADFGAVE